MLETYEQVWDGGHVNNQDNYSEVEIGQGSILFTTDTSIDESTFDGRTFVKLA